MNQNWSIIILGAYVLVFMAVVVGFYIYRAQRQGGRLPVTIKLLREPGETLRRRMMKFEDQFSTRMGAAALIPLLLAGFAFRLLVSTRPSTWQEVGVVIAIPVVILTAGLITASIYSFRYLTRYRNDRLGYLGERVVAEHLQPLLAKGYSIFHDVPATGRTSNFNLDHVVVGPSGVSLVETKARRKYKNRNDKPSYTVYSDGQRLKWPWGSETADLEQTTSQAAWLHEFIRARTGLSVSVKSILAIPGWWVESEKTGHVSVVNSKSLPATVVGSGKLTLTPVQADLISRQLDVLCRDVED